MTTNNAVTNRAKFQREYGILHGAAVGVTVIRTKEPFRAQEAICEWAIANQMPYQQWSVLTGWNRYDMLNPQKEPVADNDFDILSAMKKIDGVGTPGRGFPSGVYVVLWPHVAIPRVLPLMQVIAELVQSAPTMTKRVALIVPLSFELPQELQDSIAILDFDVPNREELRECYDRVVHGISETKKRPSYHNNEIETILNGVVGMSEMEAEGAIARAAAEFGDKCGSTPLATFVASVLKVKTEAVKRSEVLEVMPAEKMGNVGGLANLKTWVAQRKNAFSAAAREAGVDMPKGVLLVGPPGTGKSLAAKAIASELGQSLIRFDVSRVYGSLIGQTEGKVRDALKTISAMAPCVVMVDELDKVFGGGGDNNGGVSTRVLGSILTFMQEDTSGVFWVMTANRVKNLPSEIVRKGRLDEIWSVSIPSEQERADILAIHLHKRKVDINGMDFAPAVTATAGFVGAEIEAAVAAAKLHAFNTGESMTGELIAAQTGHTKPISEAFAEDFRDMQTWAENNARAASAFVGGSPAPGTGVPSARQRVRNMPSTNLDG